MANEASMNMTTSFNGEGDHQTSTWNTTEDTAEPSYQNASNTSEVTTIPPAGWAWEPMTWEWQEILQLLLSITGIIGNGIVMLVLFQPGRKRRSTDTLIAALAVADFLTSVFIIPHPTSKTVPKDGVGAWLYCRILDFSALMWISVCASIFTLTTISVQRLLAVRYPFAFKRIFSPRNTTVFIIIIWIFAIILYSFIFYLDYDEECHIKAQDPVFNGICGFLLFLVVYLAPITVMITAHVLTVRELRRQSKGGIRRHHTDKKLLRAHHRVIEMLFIVVVTFIICWTPDQIGFLLLSVGVVPQTYLYTLAYRIFVLLAFVNSCANPFIYAARNTNFRKAFQQLFGRAPRGGFQSIFDNGSDTRSSGQTNMSDITK